MTLASPPVREFYVDVLRFTAFPAFKRKLLLCSSAFDLQVDLHDFNKYPSPRRPVRRQQIEPMLYQGPTVLHVPLVSNSFSHWRGTVLRQFFRFIGFALIHEVSHGHIQSLRKPFRTGLFAVHNLSSAHIQNRPLCYAGFFFSQLNLRQIERKPSVHQLSPNVILIPPEVISD